MIAKLQTSELVRDGVRMFHNPSLPDVVDKVNELVEWANARMRDDTAKSPGFRPLHIEDGQVQDDVTLKAMQENQLRYQTPPHQSVVTPLTPSVPEAEPPEQELTLEQAMTTLEQCSLEYARVLRAGVASGRSLELDGLAQQHLNNARAAVRAAAHREYAQPKPFSIPSSSVSCATDSSPTLRIDQRGGKFYYAGTDLEIQVSYTTAQPDKKDIEWFDGKWRDEHGRIVSCGPAAQPGKGV